ncbi:lipoate--protein ligase, partial [Vibrio vulnificus]
EELHTAKRVSLSAADIDAANDLVTAKFYTDRWMYRVP